MPLCRGSVGGAASTSSFGGVAPAASAFTAASICSGVGGGGSSARASGAMETNASVARTKRIVPSIHRSLHVAGRVAIDRLAVRVFGAHVASDGAAVERVEDVVRAEGDARVGVAPGEP